MRFSFSPRILFAVEHLELGDVVGTVVVDVEGRRARPSPRCARAHSPSSVIFTRRPFDALRARAGVAGRLAGGRAMRHEPRRRPRRAGHDASDLLASDVDGDVGDGRRGAAPGAARGRRRSSGSRRRATTTTSIVTGLGCRPNMPVRIAARTLPGSTSQVRSTTCSCSALIQPASCAVCIAVGEQAGGDEHQHEAGDA